MTIRSEKAQKERSEKAKKKEKERENTPEVFVSRVGEKTPLCKLRTKITKLRSFRVYIIILDLYLPVRAIIPPS